MPVGSDREIAGRKAAWEVQAAFSYKSAPGGAYSMDLQQKGDVYDQWKSKDACLFKKAAEDGCFGLADESDWVS